MKAVTNLRVALAALQKMFKLTPRRPEMSSVRDLCNEQLRLAQSALIAEKLDDADRILKEIRESLRQLNRQCC